MLLLEGLDMYGLGNWAASGDHVATKTAAECRAHYFQIYIDSPNFPLPWPVPEMAGVDPLQVCCELVHICDACASRIEYAQMAKDKRAARQSDAHMLAAAPNGNTAEQPELTLVPKLEVFPIFIGV